jgi:hypothetical protein
MSSELPKRTAFEDSAPFTVAVPEVTICDEDGGGGFAVRISDQFVLPLYVLSRMLPSTGLHFRDAVAHGRRVESAQALQ